MPELIDRFRAELEKINVFAASTIESYTLGAAAFLKYARQHLGINPLAAKPEHLLQYLVHLKHSGMGPSRVESNHYGLKSFFAFACRAGLIETNPAEALPLIIRRRRQRTAPASPRQAFRLLTSYDQSSWRGLRDYTMACLLWALGLRTFEVTGLAVRDFEPGHGLRIGLLRIRGKNKKQRALFVVDRLFDTVTRYLAHPQSPHRPYAPMFPAEYYKALSNNRFRRIVKDQSRKAGCEPAIIPRMLRHGFATEMHRQHVPLWAIQAMMGHDAITETAIYVHVSDHQTRSALEQIGIERTA